MNVYVIAVWAITDWAELTDVIVRVVIGWASVSTPGKPQISSSSEWAEGHTLHNHEQKVHWSIYDIADKSWNQWQSVKNTTRRALMTKWLNECLIIVTVNIINIVSLSSRPIQGFSPSSVVSLLQLDTLSACELTISSARLSASQDGRCEKQVGADLQQWWPWQKSDDLWRAAISIIMKKLISWWIGLRVRLREVVGVGDSGWL